MFCTAREREKRKNIEKFFSSLVQISIGKLRIFVRLLRNVENVEIIPLVPFTIVIFEEKAIFRKDAQLPRQEWQIEIMAWNRNKNCNRRARQANSTNFSYTKKERKKENTFSHSRYNWHDKRSTRSSPCRIFPDTGRTRRVVNDKIVYLHIDSSTKVNYGVS